jgi:hypothetical protein
MRQASRDSPPPTALVPVSSGDILQIESQDLDELLRPTDADIEEEEEGWTGSWLGHKKLTKRTRWANCQQDEIVVERNTYSITLPFLTSELLFSTQRSSLNPMTYSLKFEHVLDRQECFDMVHEIERKFSSGKLADVQKLLVDRKLTLSSRLGATSLFAVGIRGRP